ncbi:DUF6289 family protein [Umezawaea tangerina]|uniref:Peptidase inhibitor family I36 n=1 Tax=Umezawaea tangerina TaxID=84725 RepID=A0A2T0SGB1_9PSEU|nr:DUF6289 family protein [Umezawaea tangerina]PRY32458.1 hypothetical protein CLV43_12152 [Umezawaea tangerina]
MTRRLATALSLVLATAVVPLVSAGTAQALPACKSGYQCTTTFYSSADRELPVGGTTRFCDGTVDTWGSFTRYATVTQAKCEAA